MDEVQGTKTILGTYSIKWMCTTTGRSEPTGGRIEMLPAQHKSDGSGWLPHEQINDESTTDSEDLLVNTSADGSEDSSASSTDETPNTEDPATAEISWNIPCIAHFYWGAWEATFYCTYNIHNHSFSPWKDGLYPFAIQAMNERM